MEQTLKADRQLGVALWDVDKDTVQPLTNHPGQFYYWRAMNHHIFQIVMKKMEENEEQMESPTRNTIIAKPYQCSVHKSFFCRKFLYFDGLQMIAGTYRRSENRYEIVMADPVG